MQIHVPLTIQDREFIEFRLRLKYGVREIARRLVRDHSVISREVRANGGRKKYAALAAQKRAERMRKRRGRKRKLDQDFALKTHVVTRLRAGWAPHVISGRLRIFPPPRGSPLSGSSISHEAIYQYIYDGEGRYEGLYHTLRYKHRKRHPRFSRKPKKNVIPERISIHDRPEEIGLRLEVGHWESDTVIYHKQPTAISVQSERKTRLVRIHRVADKTALETEWAWRKTIESLPERIFKTMTFDNGTEGANHLILRHEFRVQTYHCDAFASWQKGGVENVNGIIRRYLPKQKDLSVLTDREIYEIQETINDTPRKSLGYFTPNEVVRQYLKEVVR